MARQRERQDHEAEVDRHIGAHIRRRRLASGMSQQRLGDALGVSFQQIQKYERGIDRVSAGRLWMLAAVLRVPVAHFFEGTDELGPSPVRRDGAATIAETDQLLSAFGQLDRPSHRRVIVTLAREIVRLERQEAEDASDG